MGLLNKQRHPGLILTKDEQQTARKHQAKQPLTTEQLGCNKSISEEQHQRGAASVRETTVRHRVEELAPNCQHPHHKKYLEIKGIMSDTVAPSLPLTPFTPPPTPPFFFFFFFFTSPFLSQNALVIWRRRRRRRQLRLSISYSGAPQLSRHSFRHK